MLGQWDGVAVSDVIQRPVIQCMLRRSVLLGTDASSRWIGKVIRPSNPRPS